MSQQTLAAPESSGTAEIADSTWAEPAEIDDFSYTPISPWGPIALGMGFAGLSGLLGIFGLGLAAFGVFVSVAALLRIRAARGMVRGLAFAIAGLVLSVGGLSAGSMKMAYDYRHECPEGFLRVNFPKDISEKQFLQFGPRRALHPEVAELIDQQVFLKGFMYQTKSQDDLRAFVLLKDDGKCCFGGSPKPYDMIYVRLMDGKTTRSFTGKVAIAGVLRADVTAAEGEPVYMLDATTVEQARTPF